MKFVAVTLLACVFFSLACIPWEAAGLEVTLLHTGATFAQVLPVDDDDAPCPPDEADACAGGIARRMTYIQSIRNSSAHGNVLLVDVGQLFQGSVFFNEFDGLDLKEYYEAMGYMAFALDQREFFSGIETLSDFMDGSSMKFVSSNMNAKKENRLKDIVPFVELHLGGGAKVGFTSFVGDNFLSEIKDSGNLTIIPAINGVRKAVGKMLDNGVNIIVVAVSEPSLLPKLTKTVYGVDVYIVADNLYSNDNRTDGVVAAYPDVQRTPWGTDYLIVGTGTFGKRLGVLDMEFDSSGHLLTWIGESTWLGSGIEEDPTLQVIIEERYQQTVASSSRVIGSTLNDMVGEREPCRSGECHMGNFFADSIRRAAGTDIGFYNGGGIRASWPAGNIKLSDVLTAFQFAEENAFAFSITGAGLRATFEHSVAVADDLTQDGTGRFLQVSGLQLEWNPNEPVGRRVIFLRVLRGRTWVEVQDSQVYSVVTGTFLANGGDDFDAIVENSIDRRTLSTFLREIIVDSVEANSPLDVKLDGRIKTTDAVISDSGPIEVVYVDWDYTIAIVLVIISMLTALLILVIFCFVVFNYRNAPVKSTSITFHTTLLVGMFLACFVHFLYIGKPNDSICAFRPWTSLVFTLVFGGLASMQVSTFIQWLQRRAKKEEGVLYIEYGPLRALMILGSCFAVHVLYLVIWTAVDHPEVVLEEVEAGEGDAHWTCRSDPDTPWLIVLFIIFALQLIVGVASSIALTPVLAIFSLPRYLGGAIYALTCTTIVGVATINALRDIPEAAFGILAAIIIISMWFVIGIVYIPLIHLLVFKRNEWKRRKGGKGAVSTASNLPPIDGTNIGQLDADSDDLDDL